MNTKDSTIDELINELINKNDCGAVCALGIFNKMSAALAEASSENDVYQIIGEGLHELVPDSVVLVNSFDESSGLFYLKALLGANAILDNLARIVGTYPIGMSVRINDVAKLELSSGTLKKVPGGIYELTMGALSKQVCVLISKLLNISDVYAIGISWQGQLFGSINFLMHNNSSAIDKIPVKAFVSLASIAIQRWHVENALRKSEQHNIELLENYKQFVQFSTDMIFTIDLKGNFLFANASFYTQLGYSEKEIKEINNFRLIHPDDLNHMQHCFASLIDGKSIENLECRYKRKDGSFIHILNNCHSIYDEKGNVNGSIVIARNITGIKDTERALKDHQNSLQELKYKTTSELELLNNTLLQELSERKQAEEESKRIAEQLENLMATAPILIIRSDFNTRITYINEKVEEVTGYTKDYAIGKYWTTAGVIPPEYVGKLLKRLAERLLGRAPDGMEVPLKCKDGSIKYFTGAGQIIRENGKPIAYQVLALDITRQKEAEDHAEKSLKRLVKALEDMVSAMVVTMEIKDPYTAGHQRRVAQLAYGIAGDIGLDEDQQMGIRFAGLVHDIGKIRVPAEILTCPRKLDEAEMSIIKMHPGVGYEILKNIDFQWPLAKAVLQHHERLDGSGYPDGLTGKEILLEAKILSVADVVEAMASHRPYRPALGLESALEEIDSNKNRLYDTRIVNSCLKLFREKGFKFEEVDTDRIA